MKHIMTAALGLSILAPVALADEQKEDPFQPLRFLVGSCWKAPFPDGENFDTHCFEDVYDGAFIYDRHLVRGNNPDYRGETMYHWNGDVIGFTYWNSLGGVSTGWAEVADNGDIVFPETYKGQDGELIEIRTIIRSTGQDSYLNVSEEKKDDGWREIWTMEFKRLETSAEDALE